MSKLSNALLFILLIVPPLLFLFNYYGNSFSSTQDYIFKSMKPANHFLSDSTQYKETVSLPAKVSYKYILTWCEAYGGQTYGWAYGSDKFKEAECLESRCFLTSNRWLLSSVSQFDAIMFHQRSFSWGDAPKAAERRPEQRYVHWMFESPAHLNYDIISLPELSNYFNWSMSYRLDSTFPSPYGSFENVGTPKIGILDLITIIKKNVQFHVYEVLHSCYTSILIIRLFPIPADPPSQP